MLTNILRFAHSVVIGLIIYHIVLGHHLSPVFFIADLVLIAIRSLIENRVTSRRTRLQILCTMTLGYIIFPNRLRYIGWIYLWNGIEFHRSLKSIRAECFLFNGSPIKKYFAFVFDFIRFAANEYMFLGILMMVYKFIADEKDQPLPENYVILYQLIVTASTIGYGDVTPKSEFQMIFFTYTIPFICGSFVIYTNYLVDLYMSTFFGEEETSQTPGNTPIETGEQPKEKTD